MNALLAACGGFLLAVLWFDLMFDVQVLRHRAVAVLPDPVLASIAGYYRRVTTEAHPMSRLVALVMVVLVTGAVVDLAASGGSRARPALALALGAAPIALAAARTVPNAVRLGRRADAPEVQSALARAVCRDHLVCLAAVVGFVALQLLP
jgi:hypothetical protein